MQFYIAIDGEKRGPYPIYRVIEQLRAGEVSPDALGWEADMDSWKKLREIPAFADAIDAIENPPAPAPDSDAGEFEPGSPASRSVTVPDPRQAQPGRGDTTSSTPATAIDPVTGRRPFSRFAARMYDYLLVSTIAFLFSDIPPMPVGENGVTNFAELQRYLENYFQDPAQLEFIKLQYMALFLWHFVEGLLLSVFGTTPGKLLFGIRVTGPEEQPHLSALKGIARAFLVWAAGFGLALFPFYLVGGGVALYMLLTQGTTIWDRVTGTRVEHRPLTPARILMAIGGFLLLMILPGFKFS